MLVGGPLSDQRGRRAVVLPAALLAVGGTALLAAAANRFGLLLAGRLVVGLGSGAVFSAGTAWVQDLSQGTPAGTGARRAAVALSAGFGGGPLIAGACAQWFARPVLIPYVLQAVVLSGAIAIAWRVASAVKGAAIGAAAPPGGTLSANERAQRRPRVPARFFRELGLVAPWVFALPSIAFVVLPAQVRAHVGGFAIIYAGLISAVTLAAGIVIQPLARTRPARRVAVAGLLAGGLGLGAGRIATWMGSPLAVLGAAVLLGVGYGCCLIAGLRWIEATTPAANRGRITGIFYVLAYLGFWAPTLMAAVATTRWIRDGATLWMAAGLALVTAAITAMRPWRSDEGDEANYSVSGRSGG